MIVKEDLIQRIKDLTTNETKASTESIIAFVEAHNLEEEVTAKLSEYSVIIWDKVSPINGIAAEEYMKEDIFVTGNPRVFLISAGGKTIYFQPITDALLTEEEILSITAKSQIDFLATHSVMNDLINKYLDTLN